MVGIYIGVRHEREKYPWNVEDCGLVLRNGTSLEGGTITFGSSSNIKFGVCATLDGALK
jgi:hypothetical protein